MTQPKPVLIYIAGAYRARTPWEVERNVRAAETTALHVACMGAVPVCVHSMYRFFDKAEDLTPDYWIEATIEIMRRCDAVLVLRGVETEQSKGTQGEIAEAKRLGLPVFTGLSLFSDWLEIQARAQAVKVLR